MASAHEQQAKVRLHPWYTGIFSKFAFGWAVLFFGGGVPWVTVQFVTSGRARELPAALLLSAAVGAIFFWQLRQRPTVYGSADGLDLTWPWGQKRHLPWEDVLDVQDITLPWSGRPQFRLGLRQGSLILYARRDFPERIYHLKLTRPTE